jgi:hypothetical protein
MVYDSSQNELMYAGGAVRPYDDNAFAADRNDAWILTLDNMEAGWAPTTPIPYLTNHVSFVTAINSSGLERHYIVGGQVGENEHDGNNDQIYEWVTETESWIEREHMPFTRGHAGSSTRAIGCGFLIAGGSTNEFGKTDDVSYYDIPTDSWTSIGNISLPINTPVCDISGDYMYCESGFLTGKFSWRRKILMDQHGQ